MKWYEQNYKDYRIMEQTTAIIERLLKRGDCIEIHACEALTKTGKVTMNSRSIAPSPNAKPMIRQSIATRFMFI